MTFTREPISEADIAAYRLNEINDDLLVIGFGNGWVIDRDRDIYLRWIRMDRENPSVMKFTFYWKGTLLHLAIVSTHPDENYDHTVWALKRTPIDLPPELERYREEILQDLRDALVAYGSFGMSSTNMNRPAETSF